MMQKKRLESIADDGSIEYSLNKNNGIVSVRFLFNGSPIQAQYSMDHVGVYAFEICEPEKFFDSITKGEKE
jgi:hypothetical protein